jgi:hypothetical protein
MNEGFRKAKVQAWNVFFRSTPRTRQRAREQSYPPSLVLRRFGRNRGVPSTNLGPFALRDRIDFQNVGTLRASLITSESAIDLRPRAEAAAAFEEQRPRARIGFIAKEVFGKLERRLPVQVAP